MLSAPESLVELTRKIVEPMGYELVGVEYLGQGGSGSLVRVYIDQADGITVDDCAAVSRQISGVLDVEDPIRENYQLEVSSPGLDRPLFYKEHFEVFAGSQVCLKMHVKVRGRWRFEGLLIGMQDNEVVLEVEGERFRLPLDQMDRARLVPEF